MKILHVVQSLDPAWGGIARVLPMLATELARAGDTCCIATLTGGRFGRPAARLASSGDPAGGVEVLAFAAPSRSRLGRSREFDGRIGDLVSECDVVHLHGLWTGQNRSAGKAARRAGKPYIMTPHSMMMPWAWRRSAWKKRLAGWAFEYRNLRGAACLHALAEGEAAHMRALGFNPRIEVLPNGLHAGEYERLPSPDLLTQRFPELKDRRWVLFLGRIHPQKGIEQVLRAGFDVLAVAADWHLIIAGPDEIGLQSVLEAAARRKGAADRVTFTGQLSREEVLAALAGATLLLQPSMSEGLSMSILEAMAAGVPVLISDACNMPEVRDADAGRVVEPLRRPVGAALKELATLAPADLKAMGERGRALVRERFDWSALIPRYRQMYEKVAAGAP